MDQKVDKFLQKVFHQDAIKQVPGNTKKIPKSLEVEKVVKFQ